MIYWIGKKQRRALVRALKDIKSYHTSALETHSRLDDIASRPAMVRRVNEIVPLIDKLDRPWHQRLALWLGRHM